MDHLRGKAIIASGFHASRRGSIDHFQDTLFEVGDTGEILSVCLRAMMIMPNGGNTTRTLERW